MAKRDSKITAELEHVIRAEIGHAIASIWIACGAHARKVRVQVTLDDGQVIGQRRELRP